MYKSIDAQNASCNAVTSLADQGSINPTGQLNLYDFTSSVLAQFNLSNPAFALAVDGTAISNFISDTTALMDGTAVAFSVLNRDASSIWTGTVSNFSGSGDCKFNSTTFIKNSTITVTDMVYVVPPEFTYVGEQGLTGIKGSTGLQGPYGGPSGVTGIQGSTGVGTQGSTGLYGLTGIQGIEGLGFTGIEGPTGPFGGPPGETGIQGPTGPSGAPQGVTGIQGDPGIGSTGIQGAAGVTGLSLNGSLTFGMATSRYALITVSGEETWCVSASTCYSGLAWSRSGTTLTITRVGHGHLPGNTVIIRNTNLDYQVVPIDTVLTDSFNVTTLDSGNTADVAGAYSLGFSYSHVGSPITGGTLLAPSGDHADCQLISLKINTGIRSGTTYDLFVPASAVNGAGSNTGIGDTFVPDLTVRSYADNLAAIGATVVVNNGGAGYSTYQIGNLGTASLIRILILHF